MLGVVVVRVGLCRWTTCSAVVRVAGWVRVAAFIADWAQLFWAFASVFLYLRHHFRDYLSGRGLAIVRGWYHEFKPFYLPAGIFVFAVHIVLDGWDFWQVLWLLSDLWMWRVYRDVDDDDEDRWKRRKDALAGRVKAAGHRLVVVPAGAS